MALEIWKNYLQKDYLALKSRVERSGPEERSVT